MQRLAGVADGVDRLVPGGQYLAGGRVQVDGFRPSSPRRLQPTPAIGIERAKTDLARRVALVGRELVEARRFGLVLLQAAPAIRIDAPRLACPAG